jgi:hypothetical protein
MVHSDILADSENKHLFLTRIIQCAPTAQIASG